MGEESTKKRKRGSLATKISIVVSVAVIVSNLISLLFILNNAKAEIRSAVQNSMMSMVQSSAKMITSAMDAKNGENLTYEEYASILGEAKIEGIDSSYVYVVDQQGTMLYHPTESKVGQAVENVVVQGVVEDIGEGKHPEPETTVYDFNGTVKYAGYVVIQDNYIVVVSADESDALSGINAVSLTAVLILAAIFVIASIFSYIFGRRLARPLINLSKVIEQIAGGKISISFDGIRRTNDEIGLISEEMQDMTHSLEDIVLKIREAGSVMAQNSMELNTTSEQTLTANSEISKAVEDVAEGSTDMASSISDINDNLANMASETNVIDSAVMDIKQQTASVQESSRIMSDRMRHMEESSVKMNDGVVTISGRIQKVNEVVDKVGDIVSVIESISGQTNLLSLNASIEAARAGEAGKGFAVVAEEIRMLSDNTNQELNNIKDIIAQLVQECGECVKASDAIVMDNAAQKEEIESVLQEFGNLDDQIGNTAEKAEEIKKLVDEMVLLNGNITESSSGLTDVSSANAAATEEMTANIEELNAMMHGVADMAGQLNAHSDKLNEALQYFK